MELKCLGSGSSGNCYIFQAATDTLIVECGLNIKEIYRGLNYDSSKVVGCLVSHEHRDHSKSVPQLLAGGIRVLALPSVFESHGLRGKAMAKELQPMHGYKIGGFKVLALPVAHDVPCLGFLIEHPEMGKTMFVTDTMMLEYQLPEDLDHLMLECNYADDILQENIMQGVLPKSLRDRLMGSHMELETAKGVVRSSECRHLQEIILLHLSGNNSDGERFKREMEATSGLPTIIAGKGLRYELTH